MHLSEEKVSAEEIYNGKVVKLTKEKAKLEDGQIVTREVIHHPGGVCVVPLTDDGYVYMVKQFRYPFQQVLLEIPAGKLEYGEDHRECGLRELKEEIGAECEKFTYLGNLYPTVAYDTEVIHMYLAQGLSFGDQNLDDEEFLDVVKLPFNEVYQMVMDNKIPDSKTQLAILKTMHLSN